MKKMSRYLSIIFLIFLFFFSHSRAQSGYSDNQAIAMVKEFYTKYMTGMGNDLPGKELEKIQKQYCTPKLFKKIPELGEKIDQDPFLKTQDSNAELLKTLTVEKDMQKEGRFIVRYKTNRKIVIHLAVVKMNGNYKIDNVW